MYRNLPLIISFLLSFHFTFSQGTIEADTVIAAHVGDGSKLTNLPPQNLAVSISGDTLYITEGNWVLIPGLSASNSGNAFANAGVDIINACQTSFNLNAGQFAPSQTGLWTIISGTGGNLINPTLPQALFIGQEGESYVLQWTVNEQGGSSSFDQVNVSIAVNTQTSLANAGQDLFAIMTQMVTLNGNAPLPGSEAKWEIISGIGGILGNDHDPMMQFSGVPGESYTLRWQHFNDCSTSTDEVVLTFSQSASGTPSANGRYYIPDPKFRQYLQIAYPSVMDGDSLIVAMGNQVDKVKITNLDVSNLDGIQYLIDYTILEANYNENLTSIPNFSNAMSRFECMGCQNLSIIPPFPNGLDTIIGSTWIMNTLPEFPTDLGFLELHSLRTRNMYGGINYFRGDFPNFSNGLKYIEISELGLSSFPTLPESCEYVLLGGLDQGCECALQDTLNIPTNAKEFRLYSTSIQAFPKIPHDQSNLEDLSIEGTNVFEMPSLYGFVNLDQIHLNNNGFLRLDSLPFALQQLHIDGNPIICVENKPPLVADVLAEYDICPEQ